MRCEMAVTDEFLTFALEQLGGVGPVQAKRMFGGAGIYCRGVMFALVADDVLYLKVDDSNRADFEEAGAEPFRPYPDKAGKAMVMSYYEAPADILEARDCLTSWAQQALDVAMRKKKK